MTDEEYCEMNHVIVRSTFDLPVGIGGTCYHDEDGIEYILVNALYCPEKQRRSFIHELRHIRRGEMYNRAFREYR